MSFSRRDFLTTAVVGSLALRVEGQDSPIRTRKHSLLANARSLSLLAMVSIISTMLMISSKMVATRSMLQFE